MIQSHFLKPAPLPFYFRQIQICETPQVQMCFCLLMIENFSELGEKIHHGVLVPLLNDFLPSLQISPSYVSSNFYDAAASFEGYSL